MSWARPLLIIEWSLLTILVFGALIFGAVVLIKAVTGPEFKTPSLIEHFVQWKYFGSALLGIVFITVLLGLGLAFWSAIKHPIVFSNRVEGEVVMENKSSEPKPNINVTSYNQQGGITAHQVNIQPGDRVLNTETAKKLEEALKAQKFTTIDVTSILGDGEAFQFASQIKAYVESKGYKVDGVNQAIYSGPVRGQSIQAAGADGILHIIIGTR